MARDQRLRMSRYEIGNYLGLSLETVSWLFTRLQAEGLLQVQGTQLTPLGPRPAPAARTLLRLNRWLAVKRLSLTYLRTRLNQPPIQGLHRTRIHRVKLRKACNLLFGELHRVAEDEPSHILAARGCRE